MAVTSYFPAIGKSPSFVYLKNKGNRNGKPMTFETLTIDKAHLGKWLVATTGDIDNDGDEDIVLGSYPSPGFWEIPKGITELPVLLILKNKTRK